MLFAPAMIGTIMSVTYEAAQDVLLQAFKGQVNEAARKEAFRQQLPIFKALVLEEVARSYTEQVKERSDAYLQAMETMEAELSFPEEAGKDFVDIAQNALIKLEIFIEESNKSDSAIISYLKRRYKEEDINIYTGRLYGGHFVKMESEGVYNIYNKMAYAPLVDKNKPWLSSDITAEGISEIIANKATEIFEAEFEAAVIGEEG